MPAKEGVGLDEEERVAPAGEPVGQGEEEEAIPNSELRLLGSAGCDHDLLTEERVLGAEFVGGPQEVGEVAPGDAHGLACGCEVRQSGSPRGGAEPLK